MFGPDVITRILYHDSCTYIAALLIMIATCRSPRVLGFLPSTSFMNCARVLYLQSRLEVFFAILQRFSQSFALWASSAAMTLSPGGNSVFAFVLGLSSPYQEFPQDFSPPHISLPSSWSSWESVIGSPRLTRRCFRSNRFSRFFLSLNFFPCRFFKQINFFFLKFYQEYRYCPVRVSRIAERKWKGDFVMYSLRYRIQRIYYVSYTIV